MFTISLLSKMEITQFFNSKKRFNSYNEKGTKKQREDNTDVSLLKTSKTPGDTFEESLKWEDCVESLFREGSERYPQVGTFQK